MNRWEEISNDNIYNHINCHSDSSVILYTNMHSMFLCSEFEKLDFSKFNTSNVTDMSRMFSFATIKELDISSFEISDSVDISGMFDSSKIETVYVKDQSYIDRLSENCKYSCDTIFKVK